MAPAVHRSKGRSCKDMRETIRHNIHAPYSLHDMNVIAFEVNGDDIAMRTQSGMVKTGKPCSQIDGYVVFHDVRWDFSYVYLLGVTGNEGAFTGEKMFFRDFLDRFQLFGFSIIDETYGFNMTKYNGYLTAKGLHCECNIEIYHEGDMVFVDETKYEGMAEVILSHDDEAKLYLVPAEVAADLGKYCGDFAANWVWNGPENGKFLRKTRSGQYGAMFGAPDFIEYLNKWAFPEYNSKLVKSLGCYDYEIPAAYQCYPKYNF